MEMEWLAKGKGFKDLKLHFESHVLEILLSVMAILKRSIIKLFEEYIIWFMPKATWMDLMISYPDNWPY